MKTNKTTEAGERTQHTPGDWYVLNRTCVNTQIRDSDGNIHERAVADVIYRRGNPVSEAQAQANALLIAAAPELLEACKSVSAIEKSTAGIGLLDLSVTHLQIVYNLCRAAIAKAEGR